MIVCQADLGTKQVMCSCGEKFCFQCGDKWHNPVHCDWVRDWKRKCETDSSTSSWLATNTKVVGGCGGGGGSGGGCGSGCGGGCTKIIYKKLSKLPKFSFKFFSIYTMTFYYLPLL